MVVNCEVKFDNNPNAIFFAGQTLSGVVELTIDKPKKIRGLVLKIEGYAKVEWTESERSNRSTQGQTANSRRKNVTYSGREDYMSSTSYLIGSPEGNQIEIAPGQYRYNFQSVLPPQLPTSCETNHGSIRYLVNVILDRPFKFDLTYKTAFTIIKQLDLNYENPSLTIPLKMDTSKTYCCWFCKTKPLHLSASIPQSGFVPGQMVNVYVEVRNDSRFDVLDVVVALMKVIKYNSQVPKLKTKEETLTETLVRYGEIKKESRKVFNQQLIIPPVPPSNSSYCRLLNVSYEVEVRCNVVKFASDPFIRLPIIVGTVPLNIRQTPVFPTAPQLSTSPMSISGNYEHLVNAFRMAQQQQSQRQNTDELPPPSYAEAVYAEEQGREVELNEIGEHTMGTRPYHPMYPFYNFNNTQPQTSSSQHENGIQTNGLNGPGTVSDSAIVQKY
ncbi:unnamed protein product [Chironomus riparius]|uniref:Arrestin C-terminal-like domain-containing protein n=1 Tax=Chironomus riparius TaxID=315576 RepID=A0A9N9WT60_9DIPT|nr:unnamed protein product [Chironomus riparius]